MITPASIEAPSGYETVTSEAVLKKIRQFQSFRNLPLTQVSHERVVESVLASAIQQIQSDCSSPNWDGNDASKIDVHVIEESKILIEQVARVSSEVGILIPELSAEPNGGIIFDWDKDGRHFSLWLTADGFMVYSLVSTTHSTRGQEPFSKTIPKVVLIILESFFTKRG